ncbi:hypothetical protein RKD18_000335 [Streptomyces phaeoluteigriseus]
MPAPERRIRMAPFPSIQFMRTAWIVVKEKAG